ncbi:hypothetical protein [Clostridium algidicarnis]|uniref:TATA-box binding protein n=2 Tax=Clostridium algidicarnis TaxID=37659 RepID=A0A2S6FZR1_9CLOT|nr:hypothetical protein [Clostridium algidicarnis]MBU3220142.1 hypothetical protein [Clostridium algidicarnis]PPK48953.1 hypothetical protein BD821_10373 [Clostridium algidicarnis DSM 15099]
MKKIACLMLICILNLLFILNDKFYIKEDFINKFIEGLDLSIEEYGIRIEFEGMSEKDFMDFYIDICEQALSVKEIKSNFNIEYGKNITTLTQMEEDIKISGLMNNKSKNSYVELKFNIRSIEEKEKIDELLKKEVKLDDNKRVYKYAKAKLTEGELEKNILDIKNTLKNENSKDIDIVYSEAGVLGTALARSPYSKSGFLGYEDINFAVMNYDSGVYLIVGTPIIYSSY